MMEAKDNQMRLRRRHHTLRRGVVILPNLITTGNMFCGFYSIVKSFAGQFEAAAWLVVIAGFFDFADGRVARMTNTQSDFGVEYDSLSDLTTFCLAPAILVYNWALSDFGRLGLAVSFLYFACGALRLARYNIQAESVERSGFQGLPSPAAAGTLVSFVILIHNTYGYSDRWPYFLLFLTPLLGLLMVSHVHYRSLKKIQGRASFLFLFFVIASVFLIILHHEVMMFVVGISYISIGIGEWIWHSPDKIRNMSDVVRRFFAQRRGVLLYEDNVDDDDEDRAGDLRVVEFSEYDDEKK